jgi:hypothetical protein
MLLPDPTSEFVIFFKERMRKGKKDRYPDLEVSGDGLRSGVPEKKKVRSDLRPGVPEKTQVRSGLRSGGPGDLRPDL